jgi:predicted MPP superfamily phosphohydrolase
MPPGGGASGAAPPARRRPARPFRRFVLYLAAAWGVLLALAAGHAGAAAAVLAAALYTTLPLLAFARGGGSWRRYPSAAFRLFVVRPALYAQLLLPVAAAAALLGLASGAPFGRALAAGRAAALAAAAAAALFFAAGWAGSRRLRVREVEARVPGLPAAFDGLRVAQLSDLHVGPQTSRRFLARVARATAALAPDLVVLTGDLVDDRGEDAPAFARWLAGLEAAVRPPLGTAAVAGNHDIYAGWPAVAAALRAHTGARVLVNDAVLLRRDGASLALVGTGDPAGGASEVGPDAARAFARVPADVPALVLAHNPAGWPSVARAAGAAPTVTLSGHTHWGQLAFPRRGWSLASPFNRHAMAGYQEGRALLYVHPGTGFWGLPFRLGAFPEVALVTLRRAPDEAARGCAWGRRAARGARPVSS